ncbi:MAG: NUDIX hydrolase [Beijerinckiaceae bacterium]
MNTVTMTRLERIEALYEPVDWAFAREQRSEIEAHWRKISAEKPALFNGIVLMQHRWSLDKGIYRTAYAPVDYASFTAWIRFGQPGTPRRNGFAMGALRAADGAFLLGVMGPHTFNAGKVYFPAGTPDMSDVTSANEVDLATSAIRELTEETGLLPEELQIGSHWTLVTESFRCAFMKSVQVNHDADTARKLILKRLKQDTDGELSDIVIVRSPADINEAMTPDFAKAYMRAAFEGAV